MRETVYRGLTFASDNRVIYHPQSSTGSLEQKFFCPSSDFSTSEVWFKCDWTKKQAISKIMSFFREAWVPTRPAGCFLCLSHIHTNVLYNVIKRTRNGSLLR